MKPNSSPDHTKMSQRTTTITVGSVSFTIATFFIALRLYVRIHVLRQPSWDDWVMVLGWIGMVIYLCLIGFLTKYGLGIKREHFSEDWYKPGLTISVVIESICLFITVAVKVSILLLYLRFIPYMTVRRLIVGTIGVLLVFFVICEIFICLQCRPLRALWNPMVAGECINLTAFFYTIAGFHILADMWILILPIPTLIKIKTTRKQKAILLGIFLIGWIATAVGCIRLYAIRIYTTSSDPIYDATPINTWTFIELALGIVCACIPTLRPLFPRIVVSEYFETEDEIPTLNERTIRTVKLAPESTTSDVEEAPLADLRATSSPSLSMSIPSINLPHTLESSSPLS